MSTHPVRDFIAAATRAAGRRDPHLGGKADKAAPLSLGGPQWAGTSAVDAYRRNRAPSPNELMAELKNTAWTCASINASVCANHPPRLYVTTAAGQPPAKCLTKSIPPAAERRLREDPGLAPVTAAAGRIEEVVAHPLLDLLRQANPVHNRFDLLELTTLYQEVIGAAYWYIQTNPLGTPAEIWVLPSQNVTPVRGPDSPRLIDAYEYRTGAKAERFPADRVIHFRYPDPRDPYTAGLSPLRACWENVALLSDYLAFKKTKFENHAVPDALVCPAEVIGEEERDRLEAMWGQRFRRGGQGRVLVAESNMRVELLAHSMGDLAALAEAGKTKEDIANAFHVPLSFLTSDTNLANLRAADHQHMAKCIGPRIRRRDEKLNEQLVPRFDPTGRLFLASDDPVPVNREEAMKQQELDLKYGVLSVNEVRASRGLPPVPWGDGPRPPLTRGPAGTDRDGPPATVPGTAPDPD